jgi:segregation and condensation protein B
VLPGVDVDHVSVGEQLAAELSESHGAPDASAGVLVEGSRRVTPKQVIEAAIFVGGDVALTARRLATLVGQDVDPRVPVQIIDSLNQTYVRENRPYEIRLLEGGYRLELREEFQETQRRDDSIKVRTCSSVKPAPSGISGNAIPLRRFQLRSPAES